VLQALNLDARPLGQAARFRPRIRASRRTRRLTGFTGQRFHDRCPGLSCKTSERAMADWLPFKSTMWNPDS
ncbi:MAG TPA: hypothetical protein VFU48_12185, partial [Nitrospira sp.]|nr:hypothetical protein [Nitrospira sp.]